MFEVQCSLQAQIWKISCHTINSLCARTLRRFGVATKYLSDSVCGCIFPLFVSGYIYIYICRILMSFTHMAMAMAMVAREEFVCTRSKTAMPNAETF